MTDIDDAWAAVHAATPPRWYVGQPMEATGGADLGT